ncbi:VanZ family protein [Leifsonia sp. Root4]|uniref:VanZ family protein n=1 Tax=Leifsonia sp. Root4 TaxID=1736525 RepID=UPI00138F5C14|nr:VanZ family protein [Leifsonia sp. Root4]
MHTTAAPPAPAHGRQLTVRLVFGLYLFAVCVIVFAPQPDAERFTGIVAIVARALEGWGVPFDIGYPVLEFAANVALFVPFGILVPLIAPLWHPWLVMASGFALSCLIEFTQTALPSRFPTASDLLANTLGTALGVGLLAAFMRLRSRARRSA